MAGEQDGATGTTDVNLDDSGDDDATLSNPGQLAGKKQEEKDNSWFTPSVADTAVKFRDSSMVISFVRGKEHGTSNERMFFVIEGRTPHQPEGDEDKGSLFMHTVELLAAGEGHYKLGIDTLVTERPSRGLDDPTWTGTWNRLSHQFSPDDFKTSERKAFFNEKLDKLAGASVTTWILSGDEVDATEHFLKNQLKRDDFVLRPQWRTPVDVTKTTLETNCASEAFALSNEQYSGMVAGYLKQLGSDPELATTPASVFYARPLEVVESNGKHRVIHATKHTGSGVPKPKSRVNCEWKKPSLPSISSAAARVKGWFSRSKPAATTQTAPSASEALKF